MSQVHLTKAERRQLEAVEDVLKPWGLTYTLERTKHLMVVVAGPKGGHWRLTIACTPRDPDDAVDYVRRNARKVVRAINQRLGL